MIPLLWNEETVPELISEKVDSYQNIFDSFSFNLSICHSLYDSIWCVQKMQKEKER